ncbi:hypothetical protein [Streptomyces sp. NPDC002088]|uniref:hypothetical protein n=1 Tax=Streptomyces sp. NPDC002088 TaxID=3154665 RepID=UPI0033192E67
MNAVLATLLGTLAGAAATIGAALATGWAQREGVRIAARSEFRKDRRQPRHETYKAFMEIATELRDLALMTAHESLTREQEVSLRGRINEYWLEMSLLGPEAVIRSGAELRDQALGMTGQIAMLRSRSRHLSTTPEDDTEAFTTATRAFEISSSDFLRMGMVIGELLDAFAIDAFAALEDDGTAR